MDKAYFEKTLKDFILNEPGNYVQKDIALRPDLAGMRIFSEPLFGYASVGDPCFAELKKPGIIGPHFLAPREWLPGTETVISLFLPFTETVRAANRQNKDWPADEWLHGRIEGQVFQNELCARAAALLEKEGFAALSPMTDPRFSSKSPITGDRSQQDFYTSNWSERHAAYICGLGTFGLSKGLITKKGIAGRYISIITAAPFDPTPRPYTGIYDYCTRCGACARNCPARAITLETGKNHPLCSAFVESVRAKHAPRYGCGKCQVSVPCERGAPGAVG